MKSYYRLMLGSKSHHADACLTGNFIGTDFGFTDDFTHKLPDEWRRFNKEFIPVYQTTHPGKSKVSAGLACGALWTVSKGIQQGDVVLCPDGSGRYRLAEVVGDYYHAPGDVLPHRRPVRWIDGAIDRSNMSKALQNSTGSSGTVSDVSKHRDEIERYLGNNCLPVLTTTEGVVEDLAALARDGIRWHLA